MPTEFIVIGKVLINLYSRISPCNRNGYSTTGAFIVNGKVLINLYSRISPGPCNRNGYSTTAPVLIYE
jgi:hypothetical protein